MAKLQVRNFPDDLYEHLATLAAESERSIEGQVRFMLKQFIEKPEKTGSDTPPASTNYVQIIPASDWFFRHDNVPGSKRRATVYQLAVWALRNDGKIVGLVTVRDPETQQPKLVTPPPVQGDYLHRDQLSDEEIDAAKIR
ncbi:FitA-like ribbon-helix-helix domain-containing protein [Dickeya zeae]|uniref:FitA-like ribbon-helix-helix domain-containing protein n=1 Tax=Dickeya zeae TaxID=204042 RepID=UPI001EE67C67|nr:hypothetical protein [Dickeya zeae]